MSKYARLVTAGAQTRTVDVVDMAAYEPLPSWYSTDDDFLERIFSPQLVTQWKADGHWFKAVPDGVQDGAVFTGSDYADPMAYVNPDNTYGDGTPIPPPV